jgi:hypothetical protein
MQVRAISHLASLRADDTLNGHGNVVDVVKLSWAAVVLRYFTLGPFGAKVATRDGAKRGTQVNRLLATRLASPSLIRGVPDQHA